MGLIWQFSAGPYSVSVEPADMLTGPGYLAIVRIDGKQPRRIDRHFRNLADALRFVGCPDSHAVDLLATS